MTDTTVEPRDRRLLPRWSRERRVFYAALTLVVLQLGYRAWATYASWYHYDDFNFMSRMMNEGIDPAVAVREYSGHVMPAAMYLSWVANAIAPYDFTVIATFLLLLQALASAGALVMLHRMFGWRPGILPPLCVYLFCVISVPVGIWWAAGANQLPLQIALFWGMASHVAYLQTRRTRHLAQTVAWMIFGLLFYEKTLLVFGALAIVTLCYFAEGTPGARLRQVWSRYRLAVLTYVALGLVYLAYYAAFALTFSPEEAGSDTLLEVASNMTLRTYLPAVFGGPLQWWKLDQWALPTPGDATMYACIALALILINEIRRSRSRSLRAWSFVAFFLICNILLVVAGRAAYIGALISLDFRFQGELSAVTALALACAVMPIRGAVQPVEVIRRGEFLGRPRLVAVAVGIVSVLGLVSSTQYARHWQESQPGRPYFDTLLASISNPQSPLNLVDSSVPGDVMWGLGYPDNTLSHMLRPYRHSVDFVDVATDQVLIVGDSGRPAPLVVPPVRSGEPGPKKGCGYLVTTRPVTIKLDGPVAFGGWWVRIGYLSSGDSPVRVTSGDLSHDTTVRSGVHALYFQGDGAFDSVTIGGLAPGVSLCTDDVTVGHPEPAEFPTADDGESP
jgi:hypothetical protein